MKIFDMNGNIMENPDLEKGWLNTEARPVTHRYKIDREEEGHWNVVAEYPETGGQDVEWVVDVPEEGRWITYDESGNEIEYEGTIPDDIPHEQELRGREYFQRYILYTEEEMEEMNNVPEPQPTADEILNAMLGGLGYE